VAEHGNYRQLEAITDEELPTTAEVAKLLPSAKLHRLREQTTYQLARQGRIGGNATIGNQWRL
jgi:hypothetical protein